VDGSDPLTPVERLFMEAGYSRTLYMAWRLSILSSLKTMSRMARLAKGWLEGEARRAAAAREKRAAEEETSRSPDDTGPVFGPVMTTSEAKELIQQEIEGGRPVSLKAFENALRGAAAPAGRSTQGPAAGGSGRRWPWGHCGATRAEEASRQLF
jgi:hypothetical protein